MTVTPIQHPIERERVLGVQPEIALFPDAGRRRRLIIHSGRTLTHTEFSAEQRWRAARIASLGRVAAGGILAGLVVTSRPVEVNGATTSELYLSAGRALTLGGEMVTVTRPVRVMLGDVFVQRHDDFEVRAPDMQTGVVRPVPALGTLRELGDIVPSEGILVLQPVYAEMLPRDEVDPCGFDAAAFAHTDWQFMDALRLVLYTWPEDWIGLPAGSEQRRNRVAHAIFERERRMAADEVHPWQQLGVPIALVGLNAGRTQTTYVDRNAVARAGGGRLAVPELVPVQGSPRLWQAQFEQFNEQLAESLEGLVDFARAVDTSRDLFRYLPPAGVLPKPVNTPDSLQFVDPRGRRQDFFPDHFDVACRIVPYEQLDLAVRQSLPLRPFDLVAPEQVEVLVPVPQAYYQPDLLAIESLAPQFDAAVRRFTDTRNDWLGRRLDVRLKASALHKAIKGEPLDFGQKDPNALEFPDPDAVDDFERSTPMHPAPVEIGAVWRYFKGTEAPPSDWNERTGFDDSSWQAGASGFGFGFTAVGTELDDMPSGYQSIFLRKSFPLASVERTNQFILEVTTSGGFIAFFNGTEVLRHNMAVGAAGFDTPAPARSRLVPVRLIIDQELLESDNVLAIQAHNGSPSTPSFLIQPRLVSRTVKTNWPELGIDEDSFGLTFDPTVEDEPTFEPAYAVDGIEALKVKLASTPLTQTEIDELDSLGLEEFIRTLEARVAETNDKVDFGFVRLQTDIYRVRQFVLGNTEGTKLATSPILAGIARGETAVATKDEIARFVAGLKTADAGSSGAGGPGGAGAAPRAAAPAPSGAGTAVRRSTGGDLFISGDLASRSAVAAAGVARPGLTAPTAGAAIVSGTGAAERVAAGPIGAASGVAAAEALLGLGGASPATGTQLFRSTPKDIEEQGAIIGATSQYHNVTVAQRLEEPIATNSKTTGIATKASVLQGFLGVGINVADLSAAGVRDDTGKVLTFGELNDERIGQVLAGEHDHNQADSEGNPLSDESAFFNAGVRALENSAVVLRQIEGRIHAYRRAIASCNESLGEVKANLGAADARLAEIDEALAEARHDLTVSRAIRADEIERVAAVNAQRDAILEEHVPFYLFRRPRFSDAHRELPSRTVNPGFALPPVPDCEVDESDTPEELSAMIDLVREAPLRWFTVAKSVLGKLNRKRDLELVLIGAKEKAGKGKAAHPLFAETIEFESKLPKFLNNAYTTSYARVTKERVKRSQLDVARQISKSWRDTSAKVEEIVSLGDVIDGNHGRAGANRIAAEALEDIRRVAACLYQGFDKVQAKIKLHWIERLSQFDEPVNLSDLHALPRFEEVDFAQRRQLQRMVDWLYGQVHDSYADATALISDLVRVCLLLASHAPVDKLVSGEVAEPKTVEPGAEIRITADIRRVHIGMEVLVQVADKTAARGQISDIGNGEVLARVLEVKGGRADVPVGAKVQIRKRQAKGQSGVLGGKGSGSKQAARRSTSKFLR